MMTSALQVARNAKHLRRSDHAPARGERVCYVHVGTHKTGTTSIQAFLAVNRERFKALGVFFPRAGSDNDPGVIAHHQLAMELSGNAAFNIQCGGLAEVAGELRATTAPVACLSSEDFTFLHASPHVLIRLRDAIRSSGFTPRIIVYLRAQASYCTAVYAENVRHGYRVPFERYLRNVIEDGCYRWDDGSGPPFDYGLLLDRFAAVFGHDEIVARTYRGGSRDNELLYSFARLIAPSAVDINEFAVPNLRHNGSLNFAGVLRQLGVSNEVDERLRFTPLDIRALARLAMRYVWPNIILARRYAVLVPVFEPLDIGLASPFRRTAAKMRALAWARRALVRVGTDISVREY